MEADALLLGALGALEGEPLRGEPAVSGLGSLEDNQNKDQEGRCRRSLTSVCMVFMVTHCVGHGFRWRMRR